MPLWNCNSCHHEWEGSEGDDKCDWCGDGAHVIEETTPFERFCGWLLGDKDE